MSVLVIAEHDNSALKAATLHAVTAAREIADKAGGDVHLLVAGAGCRRGRRGRGAGRRRGQGAAGRRSGLRSWPRREHGAADRAARRELQPCPGAGHDVGEKHHAARRGAARRDADFRHQRGRLGGHVRAADLCRQRAGDGAVEGRDQDHHRARHRLRPGRGERRRRPRSRPSRVPARPAPASSCAPNCRNRSGPN